MSHFADDETIELIESLKQQLAKREKQIVMLRDCLKWANDLARDHKDFGLVPEDYEMSANSKTALAATEDLSNCILCDAEPAAEEKLGLTPFIHAVRKMLEEEVRSEGIGREELARAISKWHGSFPNAELNGERSESARTQG